MGRRSSPLIADGVACDPCDPQCFVSVDRPRESDIDDADSANVDYNPDQGGVTLVPAIATDRTVATMDVCGDGVVDSTEECDDLGRQSGDGCDFNCLLEPGYTCTAGMPCTPTVCGDGVAEGTEECDDGNLQIGDGCTPFCEREPDCSGGTCTPQCGDGQVFPGEACDDGNGADGDGCSRTCALEPGFTCTVVTMTPPDFVDLPIVYRDFRASHPDMQRSICGLRPGLVEATWGPDRKPVPVTPPINNCFQDAASFSEWYNDGPSSLTFAETLRVDRQADGTYVFDSNSFFPLDGRGWTTLGDPEPSGHNFYFTSGVRFWFQYDPEQELTFRGDDDVWVFINGRLAVDIGGVHPPRAGSVTLDATNEAALGLTPGGLYEAAVFQAERHTSQSNYRLTLGGFFFGQTACESVCGDAILTRDEVCDDGTNDGSPGTCVPGCDGYAPEFINGGHYEQEFDSNCTAPAVTLWESLSWETETPADSTIVLLVSAAEAQGELDSAAPVAIPISGPGITGAADLGGLFQAAGIRPSQRFLRVRAELTPTSDRRASPVLFSVSAQYDCVVVD